MSFSWKTKQITYTLLLASEKFLLTSKSNELNSYQNVACSHLINWSWRATDCPSIHTVSWWLGTLVTENCQLLGETKKHVKWSIDGNHYHTIWTDAHHIPYPWHEFYCNNYYHGSALHCLWGYGLFFQIQSCSDLLNSQFFAPLFTPKGSIKDKY